jgi:hypothetical protein
MKSPNQILFWNRIILSSILFFLISTVTAFTRIDLKKESEGPFAAELQIPFTSIPPDSSKADWDGPHIFYRGEATIIKQILVKNGKCYPVLDTIFGSVKGKQITCHVDDAIKFRTTIRKSLKNEPCSFPMPPKLLAVSDIEGNFLAFKEFLINNGVMSAEYKWIFGKGHLVLNGDFFDRGLHVTECLWLIYHLEQEAIKNGGYVHFILGNHEIMNMNNDLRYVRNKYYENTYIIKEAYSNWYSPDSELGRWLQTKNIVEKIGNYVFTHGGISEKIYNDKADIAKINSTARDHYFESDKAQESKDEFVSALYSGEYSPFWFRGYVLETVSQGLVDSTLMKYEGSKIVVGHSIVDDVRYFYNQKVIAIDTKHADGDSEGLLIESGVEYGVDLKGRKRAIN